MIILFSRKSNSKLFDDSKNQSKLSNKGKEIKLFSFVEKFCLKEFIINKKKRHLINIASCIIDRKLSIEFLLYHFSNFEKLKIIMLTEEQKLHLVNLPNFNINNHLGELMNA